MNESQAIDALGALAHQVRLRIIRHLIQCGESGSAAGQIGEAVEAAPSKVTFHMASLEKAGLVSSTRVSRKIIYRVHAGAMGDLLQYLLEDCCQNDSAIIKCCSFTVK